MNRKKTQGYHITPFDQEEMQDFTDIDSWDGPSTNSLPDNWQPKPPGRGQTLPIGEGIRMIRDLFTRLEWYDLIFGPLTLLFLVMILMNLDAVLYWFALMTVRLLKVSIVVLLVIIGIMLFMAFLRGDRDRRNRRRR